MTEPRSSSSSLTGMVAVVTGASRGVGLATARALVQHGARVVMVDRDRQGLQVAEFLIRGSTSGGAGAIVPYEIDVRRRPAVQTLMRTIESADGGLDVVVNCDPAGAAHCAREAIPLLQARGGGWIVNVGDLSAGRPSPADAARSTVDLEALADGLAKEVGDPAIAICRLERSPGPPDVGPLPERVAGAVVDLLGSNRADAPRVVLV